MALPTTRITLDELRQLAAEVFEVDVRAVTSPYHDPYTVCLGALWAPARGPHVEYRSIEISLRLMSGPSDGAHAFNVCFDALEGILRRRSAALAARPRELEPGPPSTVRARIAPVFTEALPSEIPPPEPDDDT